MEGALQQRVTRTLGELLEESNAPLNVDFMSLDTEGSELDILSSFPWHERSFSAMLIEHNHDAKRRGAIIGLLEKKG